MTCRNCSGVSRVAGHRRTDPGVVDQHVDAAELLHRQRRPGRCTTRGSATSVPTVSAAPAGALDQRRGVGQPVHAASAERDVGARLGERLGERDAQPAGGAGDDGDLAVESESVEDGSVGHALGALVKARCGTIGA